ncbi:hypothetical protein F8388_018207 [Cannabis sativa]|uniref:CCHC-type domain-containing protein n=1 Tax=Cannabis sativa TaxID=3483 RepID=A0A7J6GAV0_CANSA|nr:hypothetical protein F8388_018207 [Cannabis sativa]
MLEKPTKMMNPDTTMEELLNRTTNLTVLDEEGWEINEAGGSEVNALCAMGRWCSNRPMSRSLLRTILGRVWGISDKDWNVEIKLTTAAASFLVFSFKSTKDLNRILAKNPWFLNNGILILERFNGIPQNWEICLSKFPLSGRILNLPARSITKGNLERLVGFAGEVIEIQKIDIPKIVSKGFFTFKVMYDISKPICPGFLFPIEGRKIWLPYRYDRLPYMCFNCGFVGHDTRVCAEPMKFVEDGLRNQLPGYGSWLKIVEKTEPLFSQIKNSSGGLPPISPPPGFKEISSSSTGMLQSGVGKGVNHKPEFRIGVNMEVSPNSGLSSYISGSRILEKGKERVIDEAPGLLMEVPLSLKVGNIAGCSDQLKSDGQGCSKRNGAWREECMADLDNSTIPNKFSPPCPLENPIKSPIIDSCTLMDIPLTYDSNLEALIKMEGPAKRRKVIPKRTKNNGELLMEGYRWCVGDGRSIRINEDPWLPRAESGKFMEWAAGFTRMTPLGSLQLPRPAPSRPIDTWTTPPSDVLLINTDAALKMGVLGCGLSAIIRDHAGQLVVAEVAFIHGCLSVQLAEAAAIKLGIQLALRWSIQKARLGSDCQPIVKALNSDLNVPRIGGKW